MFSGIVEARGKVLRLERESGNLHLWISAPFFHQLHVDQSVAHNGVCLTIDQMGDNEYRVTAVDETLSKTSLGQLKEGSIVNLERSLTLDTRLDGHMVQGHVDTTGVCIKAESLAGSKLFTFSFSEGFKTLLVEKGSIAIDGVSLTAFDCRDDKFKVTIIPYTLANTNFEFLKEGDKVNLEFDIIGKYVHRWMEAYKS